jgi:CheY-like chemotaxis protein
MIDTQRGYVRIAHRPVASPIETLARASMGIAPASGAKRRERTHRRRSAIRPDHAAPCGRGISPSIRVADFESAVEALRWSESHDVDMLLLDYRMPEMDGLQFTRQFRRSLVRRDVPIILISIVGDDAAATGSTRRWRHRLSRQTDPPA